MLSNSIVEQDRAHLIHPVASWRGHEQTGVRLLASARGASVTDAEGHTLIDGFAGLWCVNAGYGQESVVEAAARQMRELPYATGYFSLGSAPAAELAALWEQMPVGVYSVAPDGGGLRANRALRRMLGEAAALPPWPEALWHMAQLTRKSSPPLPASPFEPS